MAVGNSINYSVPVVGTTVGTMTRIQGSTFSHSAYSIASNTYPITVTLRSAGIQSKRRRFGATIVLRPDVNDDPGVLTKGSVSVSVNIDTSIGSVVSITNLPAVVRHALSTLLHSNLIEDLSQGTSL